MLCEYDHRQESSAARESSANRSSLGLTTSGDLPRVNPVRVRECVLSMRFPHADDSSMLSVIVQYFNHPRQLQVICERLVSHPRVEVIIHADSYTFADRAALTAAQLLPRVRVLRSRNIHEIRGYNRASRLARGAILAFTQDDRLPPANCSWVDAVLNVFALLPPSFAALGLHRGYASTWGRSRQSIGLCGDAENSPSGSQWERLHRTGSMRTPIAAAAALNVGPIIVRTAAFVQAGQFNTSYSRPGEPGIGFDFELVTRLWKLGHEAAVTCPSAKTAFRNGCGGKMSLKDGPEARNTAEIRNIGLYLQQFEQHAVAIERRAAAWQRSLEANVTLLAELRRLLPGCVDCAEVPTGEAALGFEPMGPDGICLSVAAHEESPYGNVETHRGFCAPTDSGRGNGGDCEHGLSGYFDTWTQNISSLQGCLRKCAACAQCRYVSFSLANAHHDCSWYTSCNLAALQAPPETGLDYVTCKMPSTEQRPVPLGADRSRQADSEGHKRGWQRKAVNGARNSETDFRSERLRLRVRSLEPRVVAGAGAVGDNGLSRVS
jgi:hypothetical protein